MTEGGAVKQKIFTYDYMHNTSYSSVEDDHKQEELVYHSTVRWGSLTTPPPSGYHTRGSLLALTCDNKGFCVFEDNFTKIRFKDDGGLSIFAVGFYEVPINGNPRGHSGPPLKRYTRFLCSDEQMTYQFLPTGDCRTDVLCVRVNICWSAEAPMPCKCEKYTQFITLSSFLNLAVITCSRQTVSEQASWSPDERWRPLRVPCGDRWQDLKKQSDPRLWEHRSHCHRYVLLRKQC